MIDHRSYTLNFSSWEIKAWKKFRPERDSNPWPLRYRCSALPTELSSQLGAGHFAHPDGHQQGFSIQSSSIQSSVNLGNTFLRIARERKVAEPWFLARLFILQLSIISQILELIYWTITIFSFDQMTDENRELLKIE